MTREKGQPTQTVRMFESDWKWLTIEGTWRTSLALEQLIGWAKLNGYAPGTFYAEPDERPAAVAVERI